jgi:hypothetical protein
MNLPQVIWLISLCSCRGNWAALHHCLHMASYGRMGEDNERVIVTRSIIDPSTHA